MESPNPIDDLAQLCDGPSVDLHFTSAGLLLSVRRAVRRVPATVDAVPEILWGKVSGSEWKPLSPRMRAEALLVWLHEAADECRRRSVEGKAA